MQILFNNNPLRSHHAGRQKWFRFLALAVCLLLLPAKSQAAAGDGIPAVDVSIGKKPEPPGARISGFMNRVRFTGLVGDWIGVTTTNALYTVSTNTSFRVTAGNLPGDQFVIVEEDYTNDSLTFTGTPHVPVLPATVSVFSNRVVVANLGSSGQAGIVVTDKYAGGSSFELGYLPVNLSAAGAQMAFATLGEVNGSSNVVAGSLSLSNRAPGRLRVRSDVSAVGATQVVVSVYLAGALVGSTVMADGDLGDLAPAMEINCAGNKSVACGEAWSFDPPTVITNACGDTNVTLTFTTVTNSGPCPLVTTRTWLVGDTCGNSNTCTQTVTVNCCTNPCPPAALLLFNTGVGANGTVLANGAADSHYGLVANPDGGGSAAFVISPLPGGWLTNDANSRWIGPTTNGVGVGGEFTDPYLYQLGFNVPCMSNASVTVRWAVDNDGSVLLNGNPSPVATLTGGVNFSTWHYFTITSGLLAGANTLDFYVTNWDTGATGLRVELSGTANCCPSNPCVITMTCSSNKTVSCGTAWNFDAPTNIVDACCTNYSLTFTTVTNSFFCPLVFTRTWLISDACGNSNTCSQTVTVINTTLPVFTNCPVSTNLGCNPVNIPDYDPNVRAISGCGSATGPGYLLVSSYYTGEVKRYNATTGAFIDNFVTAYSGGLSQPNGLVFDPDGNLYVSSQATDEVKRYNGTTGAFMDTFVSAGSGGLNLPQGLMFASDGNLYVSSLATDNVKRYNGTTGAFMDNFASGEGLSYPAGLVFGPGGNLYVSSLATDQVKRYNGTTGAFIDTFASGSGLVRPFGVVFGPDSNLYVASRDTDQVKRYNGTTGMFMDNFASGEGLSGPYGLVFGPGGNLYVASRDTDQVRRYNGMTGAFMGTFTSGGGLDGPTFLIFAPTGPVVTSATVDTTNGCAHTRMLTYTAVDGCGNSNTCTQVITWTVDTTPPTLTCSSNKTVQCGDAWTFDAPGVSDNCSGTNVTLTYTTTTNGSACSQVITRTWQVTDLCGNTNTCSQTVTLTDTASGCVTPVITHVSCSGNSFTLSFQSQAGFRYGIQYKNALTDPSWTSLESVSGNGGIVTVQDAPVTQAMRFYRVACLGPLTEPATAFEPPQPSPGQPGSGSGASSSPDDSLPYLFSGEVHQEATDFWISGRGMDFVWARKYRSKVGPDTAAGNGWDFSYNIRVEPNGPNFEVFDGNGRKDAYHLQADGTYGANQLFGEGTVSNNVFRLKFPDTGLWEFLPFDSSSSQGKIHRIIERNGNALTFSYAANGRLTNVLDTLGRNIQFSYNADGFISAITDFAGRQVAYAYYQNADAGGALGDLKSVTSPAVTNTPNGNDFPAGKTVSYTYSKGFSDERLNHNLLTITDAKGQTWLRNTYATTTNAADYAFDRLLSQVCGNSNEVLTFYYKSQPPVPQNQFAVTKAIVNDRVGNVSEYLFDSMNNQVRLRQFTGRAMPGVTTTETLNPPTGKLRAGDPDFFETTYAWNVDSKLTQIILPNGNSVENTYELALNPNASRRSRSNLRARTTLPGLLGGDQAAITETFVYDTTFGCGCGFNFATQITDGRTNTTFNSYDSHGNRTNTVYPVSSSVESFEYNQFGQMTAHVLPENGSGIRRRDAMVYYTSGAQNGYLRQSITDTNGFALATSYEYDTVGNIVRTVDPRGNDITNAVNQLNQVVEEISSAVSTTSGLVRYQRYLSYDLNNNLVQVDVQNVDENGVLSVNPYLTTTYAYDILNLLTNTVQEVDQTHNVVTQYAYDANRNRTLVRSGEATSGQQPNNVVQTSYDERNLLFRQTLAPGDPGQSTAQLDYDASGNLIRTSQGTEDQPRVTTYAYDGFNRQITQTDPMGNVAGCHYDANGNALSQRTEGELTDQSSGTNNVRLSETSWSYDAMNRPTRSDTACFDSQTQSPIGDGFSTVQTFYNGNSQVVRVMDDNGHSRFTSYDTVGRASVTTDAKTNTAAYAYDADSRVIAVTKVDASDLGPTQSIVTQTTYDNLGRVTRTIDNLGNTNGYAHDSRDNQTTFADGRGNLTRYTYDGLNRLTTTTRFLTANGFGTGTPAGTLVTAQSWDDDSRLIYQTDASSNTTVRVYDSLDRIIQTVFADGTTNRATYDVHGNKVSAGDANGNVANSTYDLLNRETGRTIARGAGVSGTTFEVYQYDGLDRPIYLENDDSIVTRNYDSLSRVVTETQQILPGGTPQSVVCSYDGAGNRLSCTYPGGRVVNATYDALNRQQTVSDTFGTIAHYDYFGPRRAARRDYGNGTRVDYSYDGLRRMTGSLHSVVSGGAPIDSRAYAWDAANNKTAFNDLLAPSQDSRSFHYDSVNRLVQSSTAVVGPVISYNLDAVGNRVSVTGGANAGSYFMNPALPPADFQMNQYTTTPFDARVNDANGNVISAGPQHFVYDYRNQLVAAYRFDGISAYTNVLSATYDCFGRRIEKATPAAVARCYYAGWQEIEEQDDTNATVATFVWGRAHDELLEMERGGQSYFYHADLLGSIRKVTDATGSLVEQYRYDDFGKPSFFDGTGAVLTGTQIGNDTLFTGRSYDPETGLYYYRSRYLDPAAGRFISRDHIGVWGDVSSLGNGFTYAANNPWSRLDPLGLVAGDPIPGVDVSLDQIPGGYTDRIVGPPPPPQAANNYNSAKSNTEGFAANDTKASVAGDPIPGVDVSLEQIPGGIVVQGPKAPATGNHNASAANNYNSAKSNTAGIAANGGAGIVVTDKHASLPPGMTAGYVVTDPHVGGASFASQEPVTQAANNYNSAKSNTAGFAAQGAVLNAAGDPIPGVDVSLDQIPGGITAPEPETHAANNYNSAKSNTSIN